MRDRFGKTPLFVPEEDGAYFHFDVPVCVSPQLDVYKRQSKSFKILESVLKQMLEFGMGRGDLVIAVGGGVVGMICEARPNVTADIFSLSMKTLSLIHILRASATTAWTACLP